MKRLSFILALMVFALSVYPCIDEHQHCLQQSQTVAGSSPQSFHHDAFDLCSPFCTCQCCHTIVVVSEKLEISTVFEKINCYYQYLYGFQSAEPAELLIPPKA